MRSEKDGIGLLAKLEMIIEIFPSKRVEGDKKTEIRIPSIDYARILKIRAIEQRMLDMICFLF